MFLSKLMHYTSITALWGFNSYISDLQKKRPSPPVTKALTCDITPSMARNDTRKRRRKRTENEYQFEVLHERVAQLRNGPAKNMILAMKNVISPGRIHSLLDMLLLEAGDFSNRERVEDVFWDWHSQGQPDPEEYLRMAYTRREES